MLIRPKKGGPEWLLPKGHIEEGETDEESATREVQEETGVLARIECPIGEIEFTANQSDIIARFFLMKKVTERVPGEQREHRWFPYAKALELLSHPQSKQMLAVAERLRVGRAS